MDVVFMDSLIIWLNGELINSEEARISPLDDGLLTGLGIFETLVAYRGIPFASDRHYERLRNGAGKTGLAIPGKEELDRVMREVIRANELADDGEIKIRVTISKGDPAMDSGGETWMVSASRFPAFPCSASVFVLPYSRNENGVLTGIKSTSYGENAVARREVQEHGASEGIFANTAGNVCEGTCTNIFAIQQDGQVITPPLSDGCLAGITRELVIELCGEEKIPLKEISTPIADLVKAKGAFLTSSLRGIQRIQLIDGVPLRIDPDGIITRLLVSYEKLKSKGVA